MFLYYYSTELGLRYLWKGWCLYEIYECPVVPDDYPGMNLDSYTTKVQTHMNSVEEKMKAALQ